MGRSGWFRGFAVALIVVGTAAALSAQQTAAPDSVPGQPVVTAGGGLPGLPERISGDYFVVRAQPGERRLGLVVLWRGQPRWYIAPRGPVYGGRTTVGGSTASREPSSASPRERAVYFDAARGTVGLLGQKLSLGESNVVLVDRIDSVGGPPEVVGTATIDVSLPRELPEPSQDREPGSLRRRVEVEHQAIRGALEADAGVRAFLAGRP